MGLLLQLTPQHQWYINSLVPNLTSKYSNIEISYKIYQIIFTYYKSLHMTL